MNNRIARQMFRSMVFCFLLLTLGTLSEGLAAQDGEFKGSWIANGTRTHFPFAADRQVFTFDISGHVNLQTSLGNVKDYWSECVGITDSVTGSVGRCVWKDLDGTEIYLTLQSDQLQQNSRVTGTIVDGTGKLKGISGDLAFSWSAVTFMTDAAGNSTVTGQTLDLAGRYKVP